MLDLRRLNVLRVVAREGSFSAAARELDYTQPAVSHHIQRLEAEIGTTLLLRTSSGARLTDAGQALVEHADAVIAQLAMAEEEVAAIANLRSGRVRAAAFPSASSTLIPAAAKALRADYPELKFELTEVEPPEALELLRRGDVDIAVTFDYPEAQFTPSEATHVVPLMQDHSCVLLTRTGRVEPVGLEELRSETWIAGCERCRSHLLHLARTAGFTPEIAFATDDPLTVQALVASGLGVAILPSLALSQARRDDIDVVTLDAAPPRQIAAVVPASTRQPPAVAAMLAALLAAAELAAQVAPPR